MLFIGTLVVAILGLASGAPLEAQSARPDTSRGYRLSIRRLVGPPRLLVRVDDSDRAPVGGATVWVGASGYSGTTDSLGAADMGLLPAGVHQVRAGRIGMKPFRDTVTINVATELSLVLMTDTLRLEELPGCQSPWPTLRRPSFPLHRDLIPRMIPTMRVDTSLYRRASLVPLKPRPICTKRANV